LICKQPVPIFMGFFLCAQYTPRRRKS